jgi:hypothetical protein
MKICPFMTCPHIPAELRAEYECSDKLLIASNIFDIFKMGIWQSRLIHIQNSKGESVAGYIQNVHPEPDVCYIPSWMYRQVTTFDIQSIVELKTQTCDRLVFEPMTYEFIETDSWKEQLSNSISKFQTLIPGSQIYIQFNGSMYPLRIQELFPKSDCVAYLIKKNVLCDVVITNPTVSKVDDTPDIPFLIYPRKPKFTVLPFSGRGHVLGGAVPNKTKTPAQMSYEAVLRRLR